MASSKNAANDIKFTLSGNSKTFRIAVDPRSGAKLYRETEPPQETRIPPEANFQANDWSLGTGLNRFTPVQDAGSTLRIADGYGIDLTNGKIEHGPGGVSVGAVSGDMVKQIMFLNKVWFLTKTHLYNYDGTTLTKFWGPAAGGATWQTQPAGADMTDIALFNGKLYICDGASIFRTDGTTDPNITPSADNAEHLLPLDTASGPQLWRSYDTNLLASTTDPDTATPVWSTDITVGPGEDINSIFDLSGLLFNGTDSTIFSITSTGVAIQLDKSLQTNRSSSAFSILSNTGSDVWLSDGSADIFRMLAIDFEQFEIRPSGPFKHTSAVPFSELDSRGNITSITQDIENVYVTVNRGGDMYVYKGVEVSRGTFIWSPLIRRASDVNITSGIFKLSGDSEPMLYLDADGTIFKYQIRDWTVFNTDWQVQFPTYDNGNELEAKLFNRLLVFGERVGASSNFTITPATRLDNATSFTNMPFTFDNDGINTVVTGILVGRRLRMQLTCASNDSSKSYSVRSIKLEGIRKPELKKLWDMTVIANNKGEHDFLVSLRNATGAYMLFKDRYGVDRQGVILPGYPDGTETPDENLIGPNYRQRLVIQEVLSS